MIARSRTAMAERLNRPYDRRLLRPRLQSEVDRVETHQRLPPLDDLPRINQTFEHLARNAKPQVALNARRDHSGERASDIG